MSFQGAQTLEMKSSQEFALSITIGENTPAITGYLTNFLYLMR